MMQYNRYSTASYRKPKAMLENGSIVEYDQCCEIGKAPVVYGSMMAIPLGRGIIYEVNGIIQDRTLCTKAEIFEFWRVHE